MCSQPHKKKLNSLVQPTLVNNIKKFCNFYTYTATGCSVHLGLINTAQSAHSAGRERERGPCTFLKTIKVNWNIALVIYTGCMVVCITLLRVDTNNCWSSTGPPPPFIKNRKVVVLLQRPIYLLAIALKAPPCIIIFYWPIIYLPCAALVARTPNL